MLRSKKNCLALAVFVIISATIIGTTLIKAQEKKPASPWVGELNYLYILEFEYGTGQSFNEAIAEMKDWVKVMRETGEFKSVKLYTHHTGPRAALYILIEPNSWQAIETGWQKTIAAFPDLMNKPNKFGSHSDNLLSEIPVE